MTKYKDMKKIKLRVYMHFLSKSQNKHGLSAMGCSIPFFIELWLKFIYARITHQTFRFHGYKPNKNCKGWKPQSWGRRYVVQVLGLYLKRPIRIKPIK